MDTYERIKCAENAILSRAREKQQEHLRLPHGDDVSQLLSDFADAPSYSELPLEIVRQSASVREKYGREAEADFARLLLLAAMRTWTAATPPYVASGRIKEIYDREINRLLNSTGSDADGYEFDLSNNVYVKDLQCFTGRMVPCGAQVVDLKSGMPRRLIFSDHTRNLLGNIAFALHQNGFVPYCEIHTHTPTLSDFHETGWDECYLRIAEILRHDSSLKGVIGSSWFYDPALQRISPNLAYLRRRPLDNGARLFRIGQLAASKRDALATSKTRRKLYDEGKYIPTHYALVWPRDALIDWADSTA